MYGCESWTTKKAEHWRIDAFELWCWRRLLRVPWTARRSNQSILKEISPGCSLEGLMLKLNSNTLAIWCKEMTHLKRPWCWERLRAEGDDRGWGGWMASPTQWTWVWVDSGSWWWTGRPGVLQFIASQRVGHDWVTELNFHGRASLMEGMHSFRTDENFPSCVSLEPVGPEPLSRPLPTPITPPMLLLYPIRPFLQNTNSNKKLRISGH